MMTQWITSPHIFLFFSLMMPSFSADAYIGPGLGAGMIGLVIGILASIALTLLAIIWYPLKRIFKKQRKLKKESMSDVTKHTDES